MVNMVVETILEYTKTYWPYALFVLGALGFYLFNKGKAMSLLREMMLAAARLMRKGYLENTDEMKTWVVGKYDLLPAWIRLVVSKDAWSKLVDLVAEKVKEYCTEDEVVGEVSR